MPTITPIPNNGTQVERAIRAWHVACRATDDPKAADGRAADIFISTETRDRDPSVLTDIIADLGKEAVQDSGILVWNVSIQHRFSAVSHPGKDNKDDARVRKDAYMGMSLSAMAQRSDGSQERDVTTAGITTYGRLLATTGTNKEKRNDADMANFTCLKVIFRGMTRGEPENKSCAWVEEHNYEVHACPAVIDMDPVE